MIILDSKSVVSKYLDTATVKSITKFYNTTFPSDIIFTKYDTYTSDEQVEKLTREFNIHYRSFIGSLIYSLSIRVELIFAVQKLSRFSANPGKVHFEVLVHMLRYTSYNKTLGLKYYADMNDAPATDLLIQASIKTENHLMDFSGSSWQDFPYTGRSTGAYIIFYQCGKFYHGTHFTGPFSRSSAESEYNAACTTGTTLAHFSMFIHELLNKDPDIVPEEAHLIVLYSNYDMCMSNSGKDTKHTRHITRRMNFVRNVEKCKMHNIEWCEGGLQLADIDTKNIGEHDLNPIMKYIMVRLDN